MSMDEPEADATTIIYMTLACTVTIAMSDMANPLNAAQRLERDQHQARRNMSMDIPYILMTAVALGLLALNEVYRRRWRAVAVEAMEENEEVMEELIRMTDDSARWAERSTRLVTLGSDLAEGRVTKDEWYAFIRQLHTEIHDEIQLHTGAEND